jgi:Zn-dependent protease
MPDLFKTKNTRKLPGARLFMLGFLGGFTVYLAASILKQPGIGIFLGVLTWLGLNHFILKAVNRKVIQQAEKLFAESSTTREAWSYLDDILQQYQWLKGVRDYYQQKKNAVYHRTDCPTAETPLGLWKGPENQVHPEVPYPEPLIDSCGEESAKLSFPAILILIMAPFIFFPILRQTFPYIGLWPTLIIIIAGYYLNQRSKNQWDIMIAKFGFGLALISLILFGISLLSNGISGPKPELTLNFQMGEIHWIIKVFGFIVLILSVMLHESAHAYTALFSGDPTAKEQGRISLNPLKHIDLFGTIILPAIMFFLPGGVVFGWAKPVPVEPANYRKYRRGTLAVSTSGVAVNFLLTLFSCSMLATVGILLHRIYPGMSAANFMTLGKQVVLSEVPNAWLWTIIIEFFKSGIQINMVLFSLNILPIPPLDGYGVLEGLFFKKMQNWMVKVRQWGAIVFLGLVVTHVIDYLLIPGYFIAMLLMGVAGILAKLG